MTRAEVLELAAVSLPTYGHLLEAGFCSPQLRLLTPAVRMAGVARTVRVVGNDACAVDTAIGLLEPAEVLVIEMVDDQRHAPIGAVTRARAAAAGAAGIVVDGPVTDIDELQVPDDHGVVLPVYARGTTCLTTKRYDLAQSRQGVDTVIAGTTIRPGDVVLGDANGVIALPEDELRGVLAEALASDAAEPALIAALAAGARPLATP